MNFKFKKKIEKTLKFNMRNNRSFLNKFLMELIKIKC